MSSSLVVFGFPLIVPLMFLLTSTNYSFLLVKAEPLSFVRPRYHHLSSKELKPQKARYQYTKMLNIQRPSPVTTEPQFIREVLPFLAKSIKESDKFLLLKQVVPEKNKNYSEPIHENSQEHGIHVASWRWEYVKTPFIYTAFVIIAGLCKVGYHHADFLSSVIPESCILIILGVAVGTIIYVTGSTSLVPQFTSRAFFLFLLPPIILESSYSLHDSAFFSNLGTILLYALLGTLLNCFTIGPSLYGLAEAGAMGPISVGIVECLVFSALISAVDPVAVLAIFQEIGVNKVLYFLVFGESLLNDAVTVVLYTMMVGLSSTPYITAGQLALGGASFLCVSLGGLLIGVLMGVITALVTKHTQHVRVVEPLAMLGIAYLSYLLAEMVHFSGIISIIACGLVQAQYARFNISQKSYITVKYFIKMLSAVCDTIIFLFLGMVLVNDDHIWHSGFVLWATALCLIARFCSVYFLTFLANYFERLHTIKITEQFIMAYGGLRGAVAFSLVIMLDKQTVPHKSLFITATLFIILFTVFIQGSTIKPLVNLLKIRTQNKDYHSLFQEVNTKVIDNMMAGIEEVTGDHSENYWKQILCYYNEQYLKKWLQCSTSENNLTRVYTKMVLADHYAHLYGPATALEDNQPLMLNQYTDDINMPIDDGIISSEKTKNMEMNSDNKGTKAMKRAKVKLNAVWRFQAYSLGKPRFHPHKVGATGNQRTQDQRCSSFKSSSRKAQESEKMDPSKVLRKAFQNNPYYKYHQKYNPDLVGDDQQELASHLCARRNRTKRLTLSALSRGLKSNASSVNDIDCRSSSEPASTSPQTEPQHQPLKTSLFYQSLTDDPLFDSATNIFLERAQRRRSIMSGRSTREKSASSEVSSPTTANHSARLERQQALSNSRESISEDHLAAIFEIIKEELEPTDGSINDSESHEGRKVRIVTPVTPNKTDDTPF